MFIYDYIYIYIYIYNPDYLYCTQCSRSEESNQVILLSEFSIMWFEVLMAQIYPSISQSIQQFGEKTEITL